MRSKIADVLEKGRIRTGLLRTEYGDRCGAFKVKTPGGSYLTIVASTGEDWAASGLPGPPWEHVSVSLTDRTPTWEELCWVKALFWDDEECVIQFHPPRSQYVNRHQYCLHLWKPIGVDIPTDRKSVV